MERLRRSAARRTHPRAPAAEVPAAEKNRRKELLLLLLVVPALELRELLLVTLDAVLWFSNFFLTFG